MFTGTDFLIGIGVLVVISAIASVFMIRRKDKPWEHDTDREIQKSKKLLDDMGTDPSWHSLTGNTYHDMF